MCNIDGNHLLGNDYVQMTVNISQYTGMGSAQRKLFMEMLFDLKRIYQPETPNQIENWQAAWEIFVTEQDEEFIKNH